VSFPWQNVAKQAAVCTSLTCSHGPITGNQTINKWRFLFMPFEFKKFTQPQASRLFRILDSLCAGISFLGALVVLNFLYFYSNSEKGGLHEALLLFSWTHVLGSIAIFFMLLRVSEIRKYERTAIILFMLMSTWCLILLAFTKL